MSSTRPRISLEYRTTASVFARAISQFDDSRTLRMGRWVSDPPSDPRGRRANDRAVGYIAGDNGSWRHPSVATDGNARKHDAPERDRGAVPDYDGRTNEALIAVRYHGRRAKHFVGSDG